MESGTGVWNKSFLLSETKSRTNRTQLFSTAGEITTNGTNNFIPVKCKLGKKVIYCIYATHWKHV